MRGTRPTGATLAAVLIALLTFGAGPAAAHVTEGAGAFEVELGWGEEPPRLGAENFVEVNVADAAGRPVAVPSEALSVEVVYGSAATTLPLVPTGEPGALEARVTPTRPGTYSFHVSGSIDGRPLDASASCSDSTFECVEAGGAVQFPVEDPSAGELAQRLSSEAARVEAAGDRADSAESLATAAIVVAAISLVLAAVALTFAVRARRRGSG
ncbi:MAG TPA: hypothetical protein VFX85_02605 [Solirubrobacterales bacterium]|nr:hypothetical protein [Solirubrobacterales bacterium]